MIQEDKGRTINPKQIFIISLGQNSDFQSKFNSLGVKTIDLKISDKAVLPFALAQTCKENEIGNLIWQCLPTFYLCKESYRRNKLVVNEISSQHIRVEALHYQFDSKACLNLMERMDQVHQPLIEK